MASSGSSNVADGRLARLHALRLAESITFSPLVVEMDVDDADAELGRAFEEDVEMDLSGDVGGVVVPDSDFEWDTEEEDEEEEEEEQEQEEQEQEEDSEDGPGFRVVVEFDEEPEAEEQGLCRYSHEPLPVIPVNEDDSEEDADVNANRWPALDPKRVARRLEMIERLR